MYREREIETLNYCVLLMYTYIYIYISYSRFHCLDLERTNKNESAFKTSRNHLLIQEPPRPIYIYIYIHTYMYVYIYMYTCIIERAREIDREIDE